MTDNLRGRLPYLLARLREPGTLRSLAVVLFGLYGIAPDDARVEAAIQLAIIALGLISALMPEKAAEAVDKVASVAADLRQTAATNAAAVGEARAATAQAAQMLESGRSLAEGLAAGIVAPRVRP